MAKSFDDLLSKTTTKRARQKSKLRTKELIADMKEVKDIKASLAGAAKMVKLMQNKVAQLLECSQLLIERSLRNILTCGNGGSAAEALHLAEELTGRFSKDREPLAGICLCADPTVLTCIANDFGYDQVFARQVQAYGQPGDVLIALSQSGKSPSIVNALKMGQELGLTTMGLLGPPRSPAEKYCDVALTFKGLPPPRIQEAHLLAIHVMMEQVDLTFR